VFVFLCGQDEHWIYAHSFVSAPIYEQRQTVEALALIFGGGQKLGQNDRSVNSDRILSFIMEGMAHVSINNI
jgi:hypothetical protein